MTNLKQLRKKRGLSQSELAELTDINIRTLQSYEQGLRDINQATGTAIYKLAQALNCTMEELMQLN